MKNGGNGLLGSHGDAAKAIDEGFTPSLVEHAFLNRAKQKINGLVAGARDVTLMEFDALGES